MAMLNNQRVPTIGWSKSGCRNTALVLIIPCCERPVGAAEPLPTSLSVSRWWWNPFWFGPIQSNLMTFVQSTKNNHHSEVSGISMFYNDPMWARTVWNVHILLASARLYRPFPVHTYHIHPYPFISHPFVRCDHQDQLASSDHVLLPNLYNALQAHVPTFEFKKNMQLVVERQKSLSKIFRSGSLT